MFRKRIKKEFPAGTFIPTPARVMVIIQLSLAFSTLLWLVSQPFLGDLFRIKSQMLIYQDVMGISLSEERIVEQNRLKRNAEKYANLPSVNKELIQKKYKALQEKLSLSASEKLENLLHLFIHKTSPFEIAWIILSVLISILILKKNEGAHHASWMLPGLALFFLISYQGDNNSFEKEISPFPSEQEIVEHYLQAPLDKDILKQREQLLEGWHLYLIKEWARETPSKNSEIFQNQVEKGEFMFNVMWILEEKPSHNLLQHISLFWIYLYFGWNLFFAWFVNHHLKKEKDCASEKFLKHINTNACKIADKS